MQTFLIMPLKIISVLRRELAGGEELQPLGTKELWSSRDTDIQTCSLLSRETLVVTNKSS